VLKNISIIAIIIMAWWLSPLAQTDQGRVTLDSLINQALAVNPQLLAQQDASQAARYNSNAVGWLPDPSVSVGLMNVPYDSWATDQSPMSALALGINQKIPWPGKLANQKGVADLGAKTGDLIVQASRNKIVQDLQSAYYDYSYYALAENIIDNNIVLLQSLVEVAQTKYANGDGIAADVLQAQTELSVMQNKRLEIERMRMQAAGNINTLIDLAPDTRDSYPVYLPETLPDSLSASELSAEAEANNPSLAMSNIQVDIAKKQKALARSDYWPELMLSFQYQIKDKIPVVAGSGKDFISASIGLTLPLWFYHNQNNTLNAANSRVRMTQNSYVAYKRDLENQLYDKILELDRLRESFRLYDQTIIAQARATLESANIAYQVGKVDFLKLIDAQRRLYEIQLNRLAILRDYHKTFASLEELIGASKERYQQ
jgi:cobalt-zinc-cadmium efflux system outer membrane protein